MEIKKNITVTLKDYFFFNVGLIKKTIITYSIFLFFLCLIFNGMIGEFAFEKLSFWLTTLLYYVIGLIVLFIYFGLLVYFASKKVYLPNKQYYENMEITFNDLGVYQHSDGAESGLTYDQIHKVKESRTSIILFVGPRQGILIPKKGFTEDEIKEIRKLIYK